MKTKKEKVAPITAQEFFDNSVSNDREVTSTEMMIDFAKIHVQLALESASKKFKNADNIRYILSAYGEDKIV